MKKSLVIGSLAVIFLLFSFSIVLSFSNNAPVTRTNAPSELNCASGGCHNGNLNTGSGTVSFVFGSNQTEYLPGTTYTITFSASDPLGQRYGFSMTALDNSNTTSVGNFIVTNTTSTGLQNGTAAGNSRQYIGHRNANSGNTWSFDWTAPTQGTGPVTFYTVVNAANGNNSSSGDRVYTQTFVITEAIPAPATDFSATSTTVCAGGTVGFTDQSTGGPTSWSWSFPGGTPATSTLPNPSVSYATPGTYDVTLVSTNAAGSDTLTRQTFITVAAPPTVTSNFIIGVSCNGGNDGAIDLTPAGGNGNYTYLWSNGATSQDLNNLAAGTYTVTVTDGNTCSVTDSFIITEPTPVVVTTSSTNATCGNSDGSATAAASGGAGNYSYLWSNGDTTATISNVPSGTYNLTVTDGAGCTQTAVANISDIGAATLTANLNQNTCFGEANGAIDVTVNGGTAPFSFSWSNGATTEDLSGLAAGSYSLTLTDSLGCSASANYVITAPDSIELVLSSTPETGGNSDGSVTVSPGGGTPPFSFAWDSNPVQTTATATGLPAGTYTVTVTDSNGCTATGQVEVSLIAGVVMGSPNPEMKLFPNPANERVYLELEGIGNQEATVWLMDLKGQLLMKTTFEAFGRIPMELNITSLPNGLYYIKVFTGGKSTVKKVVVRH